jgi:ABC-2 type transport system ATP-binding protein
MASIALRDVSVDFPIYQGSSRSLKKSLLRAGTGGGIARDAANRVCVQALKNITLDIRHGDRIGLIGANGAGKTTLLRVLAGVYEPTTGDISSDGHISPLFDVGLGLNPDATGYDNIYLRGLYMGLPPKVIRAHIAEIAAFSELGDYLSMPVRTYSAGMTLRLAFGAATCVDPEILLMDEWLLAGDAQFLDKARQRLEAFVSRSSILVLASHSEPILREWCNKAIFLNRGNVEAFGDIDMVFDAYHRANEPKAEAAP